MSEENQEKENTEENTEVTLLHAMIAMVNAVECSACTDSRRKDELLIVREYIDQNTETDDEETPAAES